MKMEITSEGHGATTRVKLITDDGREIPLRYITGLKYEVEARKIASCTITFIASQASPIELKVVSPVPKDVLEKQITRHALDLEKMRTQLDKMNEAEENSVGAEALAAVDKAEAALEAEYAAEDGAI